VPRGTTGDSDVAKEREQNGKKHNVTNDEADAAPQHMRQAKARRSLRGEKKAVARVATAPVTVKITASRRANA